MREGREGGGEKRVRCGEFAVFSVNGIQHVLPGEGL